MKMNCEVLEVAGGGGKLRLKLQGRQAAGAPWREWCVMSIEMPATDKAQRAFYVGRLVKITVQAE